MSTATLISPSNDDNDNNEGYDYADADETYLNAEMILTSTYLKINFTTPDSFFFLLQY